MTKLQRLVKKSDTLYGQIVAEIMACMRLLGKLHDHIGKPRVYTIVATLGKRGAWTVGPMLSKWSAKT